MPNTGGIGYYSTLTNNDDVFVADAAEAISIANAHPDLVWAGINALYGNDTIYRDRTGGYGVGNQVVGVPDMIIDGGGGFDTVNYSLATTALFADLTAGTGEVDDADGKVYEADQYVNIEGIVGTHYGDTIFGNQYANYLSGLNGDDVIDGNGGNDTIDGGNGVDDLFGGDGIDTIHGGNHGDHIWGEDGSDFLYGDGGADIIHGGSGGDHIEGGSGSDTIYGEGGNDHLDGGGDGDTIYGGGGNDDIDGGEGADYMEGGIGNDTLRLDGNDTAYGGLNNDTFIIGTGWGDNYANGNAGADKVVYTGNDDVDVFLYDQRATRGSYDDDLISIRDVETGGGDDLVFGTAGYNRIETGGGSDIVYTLGGNDYVDAGSGADTVVGYGGEDTILGNSGNDHLYGYGGDDHIEGGTGHDEIEGGAGDDTIDGGAHNDTIRGGAGFDEMTGGTGVDTFVWHAGDEDNAIDVIWDFDGEVDKFGFGEGFFDLNPIGVTPLSSVLNAYESGWGTVVEAKTDDGWVTLAILTNGGQADAIEQRIDNGTILDVELNGGLGDGPGGYIPVAGHGLDVGLADELVF